MIDLYTASTPNGHKASVTLEELELPYHVHPINLGENEQKQEWFLKLNLTGAGCARISGPACQSTV